MNELLPLSVVESDSCCSFHGSATHFGSKMTRMNLLEMTEIIESVIGEDAELAGRDQETHDGQAKNGAHFLGCSLLVTTLLSAQ